jgi:hypothetical protein
MMDERYQRSIYKDLIHSEIPETPFLIAISFYQRPFLLPIDKLPMGIPKVERTLLQPPLSDA